MGRMEKSATYHTASNVDERYHTVDDEANLSLQGGDKFRGDADDATDEGDGSDEGTVFEGDGRTVFGGLASDEADG